MNTTPQSGPSERRWRIGGAYRHEHGVGYTAQVIFNGPHFDPMELAEVVDESWCRQDERRRIVEAVREYGRRKVDGTLIDPPWPSTAPVSQIAAFIEALDPKPSTGGEG